MYQLRTDIQLLTTQENGVTVYIARDPLTGETFQFDEIERFLLESLRQPRPAHERADAASARFGVAVTEDAVEEFTAMVAGWGLLQQGHGAAKSPATSQLDEDESIEDILSDIVPPASGMTKRTAQSRARGASVTQGGHAFDQPGHWGLFNPAPLLRALSYVTRPFGRPLVWMLWPALIAAVLALYNNLPLLATDLAIYYRPLTLIQHLIIGLFTVNLLAQVTQGTVLVAYGVPVTSFGLRLALGIIPRFDLRAGDVDGMPRASRMRIYAAPLLMRLGLFSICTLAWLATRSTGTQLPGFYLTVAAISLLSFFVVGIPLGKGAGYRFLTAYLDEPMLRQKANRALFRWRSRERLPQELAEENRLALRAFALASFGFLVAMLGIVGAFVARWLELNYQGTGVALFLLVSAYLILRLRRQIKERLTQKNAADGSWAQRKRVKARRAEAQPSRSPDDTRRGSRWGWRRLLLLALIAVVLALPYPYETGGQAEVLGVKEYELYSQNPGILEKVFFDGGEWLPEGTVVARLDSHTQEKDYATTKAAILEQQATIDKLKTTPRPEDVELAAAQLAKAEVSAKYSADKVERLTPLYKKGNVSLDDYADAEGKRDFERAQAIEAAANLEVVKSGVHPMEIAAAEAELERLQEQLRYHQEELKRTFLITPTDGRPAGLNLLQEQGKFLDDKDLFTRVIDDRTLRVELAIPESDVGVFKPGSAARVRVWAYPDRTFTGEVTAIAPAVEEESFGRVVTVVVQIPNEDGMLKSGMTGFGKVAGGTKPVLIAFTRTLVRFVLVEAWSWLP